MHQIIFITFNRVWSHNLVHFVNANPFQLRLTFSPLLTLSNMYCKIAVILLLCLEWNIAVGSDLINAATDSHERRHLLSSDAVGRFVYSTYHVGNKCSSRAHQFSVEPIVLNTCLPSDNLNKNMTNMLTLKRTAVPHKFRCRQGENKYSIFKHIFNKTDKACALSEQPSPTGSTVDIHDYECKKDSMTGLFQETHCGSIPSSLVSQNQLLLKVYTRNNCQSESRTFGYFLGQCTPMTDPATLQVLQTYSKIALTATYTSTSIPSSRGISSTPWTGGTKVFVIEQQTFESRKCDGSPIRTRKIEFGNSTACKQDMVHANLYYTLAAISNMNRPNANGEDLQQEIPWLQHP